MEQERPSHHHPEIYSNGKTYYNEEFEEFTATLYADDPRYTIPFPKEAQEGLTMPEIFSYPASPHLASQLDNRPIDFDKIKRATEELSERYDSVLLEGAGGLMVPLTTELLTIDYIVQEKYPLIFVTSGKLGSINHTLLSLEAIQKRGIVLDTVLYNMYPTVEDKTIQNDTMEFIRTWLKKYFPETKFILVPEIKKNL